MNDRLPCLLALDLGTTTCRAMAFDLRGTPLAAAAVEVPPEHPAPGLAEIHAERWWCAAQSVLREIAFTIKALDREPLALGLAGLQHAIIPLDAQGQVLAPSLLWLDQRCQQEIAWLNQHAHDILTKILGANVSITSTPSLPKLLWLSRHQPHVIAKAQHLLLPKDFIRYRHTATIGTDPSDAKGTMLYDPQTHDWSPELVALAGIRLAQLPPILPSEHCAGKITPLAAQETGLPTGLPVVIGAGDVFATIIGAGGEVPQRLLIYLGTAAWVRYWEPNNPPRMAATATTGAAIRWLRDILSPPSAPLSYTALMEEASRAEPGSGGAFFLPHLCGERGPFFAPEARGVLSGLTLYHRREHLARAVLEGTCYHLRWLIEGLLSNASPQQVWATGGATASPLWMQTLADILGSAIQTPCVSEAGALGAAILAAVGIAMYPSLPEAIKTMVQTGPFYMPEESQHSRYDTLYTAWRQVEAQWNLKKW